MGAETPAEDGETKPVVKSRDRSRNQHDGHNNTNRRDNNINKKEKFVGEDTSLCGHVFEAKRNQSEQVANFTAVTNIFKA